MTMTMLILGRKLGEEIIINEDLIIKVTFIDYGYRIVKLGFEADKAKYVIDRYEIFERKVEKRGY